LSRPGTDPGSGESSGEGAVSAFFSGSAFPGFALFLVLFYELLLLGLLLTPSTATGVGAFADEFRVWCFGLDPATGRIDPAYVLGMTGPPALLAGMIALFWWEPLRSLVSRPAALAGCALAAALGVAGVASGFAALGGRPGAVEAELSFPADALRTALPAPSLALTNQAGEPVELAALRGNVVLLTAVYASCPHTCPLILAQARRAIDALGPGQREGLRVVAVTMDPSHDSADVLAELAGRHDMQTPLYNLVTGDPVEVERVLDAMGVARQRDPETGVIEHANLFLLLDRAGDVAYRLTLGDRQERWLVSALRLLLAEPADGG
jgi:protein SCO1/2